MPCPAVAEIHDRILVDLKHRICIVQFFKIIRCRRIVIEPDFMFLNHAIRANNLIKIWAYIVYNNRRCSREVLVSPCVSNDVHGYPGSLEALSFGQLNRIGCELTVRTAYKAVFSPVRA